MEPQAASNELSKSRNPEPVRDVLQKTPANLIRDSLPNAYLEEFLNLQRPALKPDGKAAEFTGWLNAGKEDIYKSVIQKGTKTPEETAEAYYENSTKSVLKSVKEAKLSFTTDGTAPKVIAYSDDFKVSAGTNANEIAKSQLGDKASEAQVKKYTDTLVAINKLEGADKAIAPGAKLKLPGQTADGAIVNRSKGVTYSQWHDGTTLEIAERGQGKASYTDRSAGCAVDVSWDPDDKKNCTVTRTYDERRVETDANGVRTESIPPAFGMKSRVYEDEQGRKVSMEFDPKDSSLKKISVQDWKSGCLTELEPDDKGKLRGKKTDKSGDVVATMAGALAGDKLVLFEERKVGDVLTRTHENGTVEEFKADKLVKRTGKDDWGRQLEEVYNPPGRTPPHRIHVTLNDNADESKRTKLIFSRTDFGEYWGETLKDGKVDQRFQIRPTGQIMFYKNQKVFADLKDGTRIERSQVYDPRDPKKVAGYQISQSRDGGRFTVTTDRDGNIQKDIYTYGGNDGRTIERVRSTNGRLISAMSIAEAGGHKTQLNFDGVSGMFTGQRTDKDGKKVEDVLVADDKIIYTNAAGSRRIELFDLRGKELLGKTPKAGVYDIHQGTESYKNDDESVSVKPVAPGRTDKVTEDYCRGRTIVGKTIRGERSLVTPDSTTIHNPDGTGARLNADSTIDRWGQKDEDNANKEPLTEAESDYLKYLSDKGKDKDVDMRDFVELHRKYATKPDGAATLSKFYSALKTLDTAKNLSEEELKALRINIMRDVAHPEEMDQSRSPTCNTEVVRRELAMNVPDQYVMRFYNAMNDGKVPVYLKSIDGAYGSNAEKPDSFVEVDPANLKMADATGRNLAARIFDNMSIQISAQPDFKWIATEDGIGKFVPNDPEAEPKEFSGMQMGDIANVLTKLTGVNRGVVQITALEDLGAAFEANGKESMIVAVNANKSPFSYAGINFSFDELYTNHVVTLTNVFDDSGATYVNFMNQWGLENDHSTAARSVPIERFLNNMTGINTSWLGARPMTPPQVISSGDPTKVHKIVDGKIVVDPKYILKNGRVQEK
ncbi:MAG: hypothetical protein K2X93_28885 [Candidatus Obscuribacterales bacterium]|nr:hypothetical protein [Candidatus Obscuribacterales bacterium]